VILSISTAGIYESHMTGEINEIDGGIFKRRELIAPDLGDFLRGLILSDRISPDNPLPL
jgi:hypothetical protein